MLDRFHLQQLFLVALALAAVYLCLLIVQPFTGPILSAVALAVLFYPLQAWLLRHMPSRPGLAATLSLILVVVLIVLPAAGVVSAMSKELAGAYAALKSRSAVDGGWTAWLIHAGARPLIYFGMEEAVAEVRVDTFLTERLQSMSGVLLRIGQGIVSNIAVFLFNAVVSLFVLFFLLRDGKKLIGRAREFLPLEGGVFDRLVAEVGQSVLANVYGVGAVAIAQGTLTGILFALTGVHSPVLWGVIAGFCSMIPIVGPPIIWVPAAVSFAIAGSWGKAAAVAIVGAGVIGTADNIIRPWIVSGRIQLHPLLVFISLLGGAQAFGFLGLFIGPAILSVTIVVLEVLRQGLPGRVHRKQSVPPQDPVSS